MRFRPVPLQQIGDDGVKSDDRKNATLITKQRQTFGLSGPEGTLRKAVRGFDGLVSDSDCLCRDALEATTKPQAQAVDRGHDGDLAAL